jgi:protein phosphatase
MTSFRHAATSHVGVIRTGNEDSGYADARMLVVADGMGGHAAGELASAAVVAAVCADVSDRPTSVADFERWVRNKLDSAHSRIGDLVAEQPDRRGMGTTFTMLGSLENSLVIAHVGDSRAYRLREGKLTQLTKDHTYVQALVDSGKLDPAQAMLHPRRNLLLRTIDGIHELELDVLTNDLRIGDRYLVCSDGLNTVLTDSSILEILGQGDPTYAAATLIDYTLAAGAPDNVSVIVADVTDADEQQDAVLIGAARAAEVREDLGSMPLPVDGPRPHTGFDVVKGGTRWFIAGVAVGVALLMLFVRWTANQYFVTALDGKVAVYQGVPQSLGPLSLSRLERLTNIDTADLPQFDRHLVESGISASSLEAANTIVLRIESQAATCRVHPSTPGCP